MIYYNLEAIADKPEIYNKLKPIYTPIDAAFIEALMEEYANDHRTFLNILLQFCYDFENRNGDRLIWFKHTAEKYHLAGKSVQLPDIATKWILIQDYLESQIDALESNKIPTGPEIIRDECDNIIDQLKANKITMKDLWLQLSFKYPPKSDTAIKQAWKRSDCKKVYDKIQQEKYTRK